MRSLAAVLLLALTVVVPAQNRVILGGTPSNLLLDLSATPVALDGAATDAFFALIPVVNGGSYNFGFATFDGDVSMNLAFGTGNWLRCTMVATHWAVLSNDACAHLPPPGALAPKSQLTSDYDYGVYTGVPGAANLPWAGATMFTGNFQSYCRGLPSWSQERWQLRTRGYNLNELWNACPGSFSVTPNFSGWVLARFTFAFS